MLAVNFFQTPYPVYPLGASLAAAAARRHGHETRFFDLLSEADFGDYGHSLLERAVQDFRPDCVGVSIRNAESTDSLYPNSQLDLVRDIVAEIRGLTPAPVVLGGAGFTLLPHAFLRHSGADYGIAGEGEEAFPAFLDALQAGQASPGLWNGGKNFSAPRQECRAHIEDLVEKYAAQGGMIGLQTRRGCSLGCLYCSYPLLEGRRVRPRPINDVMGDLRLLSKTIEKPQVAFADSVFNSPDGSWRELLRAIVRERLGIAWTAFLQPYGLNEKDLELIKASGAAGIEFGTDAACDATLRGLAKPFDFRTVLSIQEACVKIRLPAAHYVIFGGPGETRDTVEEGLANLDLLERCVVIASSGLSIYPGTGLHEVALREGAVKPDEDFRRPIFYFSPGVPPEWLAGRLAAAFRRRRDRIYPASSADEKAAALRRMGYRGLLWDTLIRWDSPVPLAAPARVGGGR